MRIGIAKPDWGIVGGFERLLARVDELASVPWARDPLVPRTRRGGRSEPVRATSPGRGPSPRHRRRPVSRSRPGVPHDRRVGRRPRAVQPTSVLRGRAPAPTGAVLASPAHLLRPLGRVRACRLRDRRRPRGGRACRLRVDTRFLANPRRFLAAAEEVQDRLARFNGLVDRVGVYHPGSDFAEQMLTAPAGTEFGAPLCVTRHEFTKRSELFVQAMHVVTGTTGVCVGAGGRLPYVQQVDSPPGYWRRRRRCRGRGAVAESRRAPRRRDQRHGLCRLPRVRA